MLKKGILILLATLISTLPSIFGADDVAITLKVRGKVTLTEKGEAKSVSVKKAQLLSDQDKIETGAASRCAIKFLDDKSLLRIKENSSCVIEAKKEQKKIDKNIVVKIGSFFASLFQPKGSFSVTTPTSVASVKGTKFWTIHLLSGITMYICIEGLLDVLNDAGRVLVRGGQTAIVKSRFLLPEVRLTQPGDIPEDDLEGSGIRTLEFGFKNENGETKTLQVDIQE
jgi:hypothetical protein